MSEQSLEDNDKERKKLALFNEQLEKAGARRRVLGQCVIKPIDWAVKGLIPTNGVTVLYGASGSGKTFLAAHLALCIASGADFLKHRVNKGKVVYIAAESPTSLERRLAVMYQLNKTGYGGYEFVGDEVSIYQGGIDLFRKDEAMALIAAIKNFHEMLDPVGVCIIDTLAAAFGGIDENSNDMATVVKIAEYIQRELFCPVVIIHHTGKDTTRGLRGHSSLRGGIEQALYVDGMENPRRIFVDKIKDEKTGDETPFDLISIDTDILDSDGEVVKGCIVQYGAFDAVATSGKKRAKLIPHGETALKAFNAALDSIAPNRYVPEELFREHLKPLFSHHDQKHRKTFANRGITDLINKNYIEVNSRGEYVYC